MIRKQASAHYTKQERRREHKYRLEEERRRSTRRKRITITSLIAASSIVVVVLAYIVLTQGGTPANAANPPIDSIACQKSEQSGIHIHAHLSISIDGKSVPIPADVGLASDGSCLYWLHTHDSSGVIHIEAPAGTSFTLKNFLDIWKSQMGYPGELDHVSGWQTYVDGKPSRGDFQTIPLQAHTLITLAFKSSGVKPDISYPWNGL
jgi:hypothetical protein